LKLTEKETITFKNKDGVDKEVAFVGLADDIIEKKTREYAIFFGISSSFCCETLSDTTNGCMK
jgi:hypothetical protein